jgi:hypothetical protein
MRCIQALQQTPPQVLVLSSKHLARGGAAELGRSAAESAMRWLIGMYLTLGGVQVVLATAIGILGIRSLGGRVAGRGEEALLVAGLSAAVAVVPLLAAYGLWRRWRLVRLVLLGVSWWSLAGAALAIGVALGTLAGLWTGRDLAFDEPPGQTLAIAAGLVVFGVWHVWLLRRPDVRRSFQRHAEPLSWPTDLNKNEDSGSG